ncbi:MAG: hypothetical protein ACLVLP_01830 [Phascolarctobacterium faecium]
MFKIFVIIIIAVGIFFWYPTSGDPIKKRDSIANYTAFCATAAC